MENSNEILLALAARLRQKPEKAKFAKIGTLEVDIQAALDALEVLKLSNWTSIKPALKAIDSPLLKENPQKVADKAKKTLKLQDTKEAYCRVIELAVKELDLTPEQKKVVDAPIIAVKQPKEMNEIEKKAFSGAMIALVPSAEDSSRLVQEDGLSEEDLHLTLIFLGEGSNFNDVQRKDIIESLQGVLTSPVHGELFSVSVFNPHKNNPCLVLGASGQEIADAKVKVDEVASKFAAPEQHAPWVAHVSLSYDKPGTKIDLNKYKDLLGEIIFDRLEVAFGSDYTFISLGADNNLEDNSQKENPSV